MGVYVAAVSSGLIKKGTKIASITSVLVLPPPEERSVLVESSGSSSEHRDNIEWEKIQEGLLHLPEDSRSRVAAMLKAHGGVFSSGDDDIGLMGLTEH